MCNWGCGPGVRSYSETEILMDTVVTVTAWGPSRAGNGTRVEDAVGAAFAEMRRVAELADVYRPGSEVDRLNASAGKAPIAVSDDLFAMLSMAREVSEKSQGAFDVTVFPLVNLWGIGKKGEFVPTEVQVREALARVGYRGLELWSEADPNGRLRHFARLAQTGMGVDLGGIAKGYAVGRAAEALKRAGVRSALIDAGGNVYVMGPRPEGPRGRGEEKGWRIAIRHPRRTGSYLGVVTVREGAVVTSGDYERFFVKDGMRYHHVLDPRTGYPSRTAQSATVVGESPAVADALSTAALVLGPEKGLQLLSRFPGYEGVIVGADGAVVVTPGMEPLFEPNVE